MSDTAENDQTTTKSNQTDLLHSGAYLYLILNFLHFTALNASRPYFSLLASENNAGIIGVGIITSLYSIGQVLLAMPIGRLIDRIGSKAPVIWGTVMFIFGVSGLAFSRHLLLITFFIMMVGLSHVVILLGGQSVMTAVPAGESRNRFVGLHTFANSAGSFVGPIIGGYLQDRWGTNFGYFGAVIIGVLCTFVAIASPQNRNKLDRSDDKGIRSVLKNRQIIRIIVVSGIVLFSIEVTLSYFPMYGSEIGLSTVAIGTILSVRGMAQMIIRPFLKNLIAWFRRDRIMIFSLVFGGLSIVMYGLLNTYWALILAAGFSGITLGLAMPLTLLAVSDVAPRDQSSQVLALRVMGNYLGQSVSPLSFGLLGTLLGLAPVFWISGGILVLSTKLLLPGIKIRPGIVKRFKS